MSWLDVKIQEYYMWLKSNTHITTSESSDWIGIETPYIGLFNDAIEIYARKNVDDTISITDGGETLHNLKLLGFNYAGSESRRELIAQIMRNFGTKIGAAGEIELTATDTSFVQAKHNLLTAIIEVSELFQLAKPNVRSLFNEDVRSYFDSINILYTPEFYAKGMTGLEFKFDFQIMHRSREILVKTFNNPPNKHNVPNFLFTWNDVKESRSKIVRKEIQGLALINNREQDVKPEILQAFAQRNTHVILYKDRNSEKNQEILKAS